jgi:transposase-like protein
VIPIDAHWAAALYIFFVLVVVIGKWIFYNLNDEATILGRSQFLEECPYCTHVYFDYRRTRLKVCPRCQSYLTIEDGEPRTEP